MRVKTTTKMSRNKMLTKAEIKYKEYEQEFITHTDRMGYNRAMGGAKGRYHQIKAKHKIENANFRTENISLKGNLVERKGELEYQDLSSILEIAFDLSCISNIVESIMIKYNCNEMIAEGYIPPIFYTTTTKRNGYLNINYNIFIYEMAKFFSEETQDNFINDFAMDSIGVATGTRDLTKGHRFLVSCFTASGLLSTQSVSRGTQMYVPFILTNNNKKPNTQESKQEVLQTNCLCFNTQSYNQIIINCNKKAQERIIDIIEEYDSLEILAFGDYQCDIFWKLKAYKLTEKQWGKKTKADKARIAREKVISRYFLS